MKAPTSARERRAQELLDRYDKCAVASLICAFVGIAWPTGILGFILALAAIVLSVIGLQSRKKNVAIAGGLVGVAAALISVAMIAQRINTYRSANKIAETLGDESLAPPAHPLVTGLAQEIGFLLFIGMAFAMGVVIALCIPRLIGWMFPRFKDEVIDEQPERIERHVPQSAPRKVRKARTVRRSGGYRDTPDPAPTVQPPRADTRPKRTPPTPHGRWIGKAWMPLEPDE